MTKLNSIQPSANNLIDDVNFKHIIEHALSCILERVDKDVLLGMIDEVFNKEH